jgi:hypothetical protein
MLLLTLPMKIFGLTGTIVLLVILYWLFIGTGMNLNRSGNCSSGVEVSAKNPISGRHKTFSNQCEIPIGWQKGAVVAL